MSPKDGNSNSSGQVNVVPSPSSSSSSQPPSSVVVQQQQQQQSGVAIDSTLLIGTADPSQMMTSSAQQQPHLQMQPQMQLQQQQQVLKPLQHHQQQLIEVQGNSLDDGTDSLDELTTASNSNAISALLDSNTNPSSSNDTNTNASLDSVIGDGSKNATTSTSTTTCTSTINTNPLLSNNTLSDNATSNVLSCSQEKSISNLSNSSTSEKPNVLMAANVANTFINLSNINPGIRNDSELSQAQQQQHQSTSLHQNVNVVVSQPVTTHVMKTFTIGTNRGNIFVPNVIATNISPHFTVHHHQYGLRNGPAPNVTVNPNGNFNTNSSAVIRPGFTHIRPFLPQSPNINFNIIGNSSTIQSPILAASLQTINKIAAQQQQQAQHPNVQHPLVRTGVNKFINVGPDGSQKILLATPVQHLQAQQQVMLPLERQQTPGTPSPVYSPQRPQTPCASRSLTPHLQSNMGGNDQQIRVLTPSEIMRTLPSLDSASFESHSINDSFGKSHTQTHTIIANTQNLNNTNMSSVTHSNNNNNSMSSDSTNINESSGSENFESIVNSSNPLHESNSNGNTANGPDYSDAANSAALYGNEPGCASNPMTTLDTPCSLGANTSATSTVTIVTNTTSYSSSSATTSVTTTTSTTTTTTTTVVTTTSTTAPETVRTMKPSKRNRFDLFLFFFSFELQIFGFCLTVSIFYTLVWTL